MVDKIFEVIAKTENCEVVDDVNSLRNKCLKEFDHVIIVDTEVTLGGKLREIKLYIALPFNLQVNLPKIFIDEESYAPIKYIPHVNSDLSICIQDESENYYYSLSDLPTIVLDFVRRAKEIIRIKDDAEEMRVEFEREFQAYWSVKYSTKDEILLTGFSLIDEDSNEEVKAIRLKSKIGVYEYVIFDNDKRFEPFKRYLENHQIRYTDIPVFEVNYEQIEPPFDLSYFNSARYLAEIDAVKLLKSSLNQSKGNDCLFIFRNAHNEFFGWMYPKFNILPAGYRKKSNWERLNLNPAKNFSVKRIAFSNLTQERLYRRTAGELPEIVRSVNVIGLGSVGSNLLHFLSKAQIGEYHLVDNDVFKVENVLRHNFSFSCISHYKTAVAKRYLLDANPFIAVSTHEKDITKLLIEDPAFFERSDYSFVIIGVRRTEEYVLDYLIEHSSQKPIFIIWVEPYLASGQMMYITPDKFTEAKVLLNKYPFRVIENGDDLFLKEGSCQSGYYPYSETYLTMFLSRIFPEIYNIIVKGENADSKMFSWIGDIDFILSKGVNISHGFCGDPYSLKITPF
ncbi:ThiF family adenylyltransferase [Parapedobacter koreensis]|uniref:ThiF family protein n=1 Tax=Parapedobacter koreensis TaxID=332977 RepID=A0A1H7NJE6_9SPHI|nr:ThiF family adenylyltransferase [Parapedobacter koreensis]SEL23449.1 ThiF family protein [Parapedobacter koreensis]